MVHNLQLNTRTQCTYRKMQNKCIHKNKNKPTTTTTKKKKKKNKQSTPGYLNYHTVDNQTISNAKGVEQQPGEKKKEKKGVRITNVHFCAYKLTRFDQNLTYYKCSFPCMQVDQTLTRT